MSEPKECHDCKAAPGKFHDSGCDTEQCPYCGGQLISCGCLEDKRKAVWIEKNLLPWTGTWPGEEEAIEFGLWSRWVPTEGFEENNEKFGLEKALKMLGAKPMGRWEICSKDTPGAGPDLNRLHQVAEWNRDLKRFVKGSWVK